MSRTGSDLAVVLAVVGRGDLPTSRLHGRTLVRHALDALRGLGRPVVVVVDLDQVDRVRAEVGHLAEVGDAAPVVVVDEDTWWSALVAEVGSGVVRALLVHDPLCPLASADFLAEVAGQVGPEESVAAVRPVTDTVKTVDSGVIGATIDRERFAALVAPLVVAPALVTRAAAADDRPPLHDVAALAAWVRGRGGLTLRKAPSVARRVDDVSAVNLLECVDELRRRVRG